MSSRLRCYRPLAGLLGALAVASCAQGSFNCQSAASGACAGDFARFGADTSFTASGDGTGGWSMSYTSTPNDAALSTALGALDKAIGVLGKVAPVAALAQQPPQAQALPRFQAPEPSVAPVEPVQKMHELPQLIRGRLYLGPHPGRPGFHLVQHASDPGVSVWDDARWRAWVAGG